MQAFVCAQGQHRALAPTRLYPPGGVLGHFEGRLSSLLNSLQHRGEEAGSVRVGRTAAGLPVCSPVPAGARPSQSGWGGVSRISANSSTPVCLRHGAVGDAMSEVIRIIDL